MSKKEKVKTTIDIIKGGVFALLSALFGIFAFIVINVTTINVFQVVACVFGIVIIIIFLWILIRYLLKNLKKLGKMK